MMMHDSNVEGRLSRLSSSGSTTTTTMEEEFDSLKKDVRAILISAKQGLSLEQLGRDYIDLTGRSLPIGRFGFESISDLIDAMPDVANVKGKLLFPVSHESTRHLEHLIAEQKCSKLGRFGGVLPQPLLQSLLKEALVEILHSAGGEMDLRKLNETFATRKGDSLRVEAERSFGCGVLEALEKHLASRFKVTKLQDAVLVSLREPPPPPPVPSLLSFPPFQPQQFSSCPPSHPLASARFPLLSLPPPVPSLLNMNPCFIPGPYYGMPPMFFRPPTVVPVAPGHNSLATAVQRVYGTLATRPEGMRDTELTMACGFDPFVLFGIPWWEFVRRHMDPVVELVMDRGEWKLKLKSILKSIPEFPSISKKNILKIEPPPPPSVEKKESFSVPSVDPLTEEVEKSISASCSNLNLNSKLIEKSIEESIPADPEMLIERLLIPSGLPRSLYDLLATHPEGLDFDTVYSRLKIPDEDLEPSDLTDTVLQYVKYFRLSYKGSGKLIFRLAKFEDPTSSANSNSNSTSIPADAVTGVDLHSNSNSGGKRRCFDAFITQYVSPIKFFVASASDYPKLEALMAEMTGFYESDLGRRYAMQSSAVKPSVICAVPWKSCGYHRATVIDVDPDKKTAEVSFLDYGTRDTVPIQDLRYLRRSYWNAMPAQALQCRLARIATNWHPNAEAIFLTATGDDVVQLTALDSTDRVLAVDILLKDGRSLLDVLIKEGVATRTLRSY